MVAIISVVEVKITYKPRIVEKNQNNVMKKRGGILYTTEKRWNLSPIGPKANCASHYLFLCTKMKPKILKLNKHN